eukprot:TRINITY_DN16983_c0_g1_i1.p1 TRINITY_DN16983_c0_g1~~TRINITY_DN16983_c0_g1_i1.p1  ORF type:complete len:196 (-),score=33.04 TRINITY_DN16983_c0_g1_i1:59-583(-)
MVVGDSHTGKTSMIRRFAEDSFENTYIPTVGVDFRIRTIEMDGSVVKLQVWEMPGQERFRSGRPPPYRGSHGIIVVYDIADPDTFNNTKYWFQEIDRYACEKVCRMLVGHKLDLKQEHSTIVDTNEAKEYADSLGIPFIEASAKDSTNVDQVFVTVASDIMKQLRARDETSSSS